MTEYVFIDTLILETPLTVDAKSEYEFIFFTDYTHADQPILEVH